MSISTALDPTMIREADSPEVEHGVHVPCQRGADFVLAACGTLLDWIEEQLDASGDPMCDACLAVERCPVCGARFKPGGWR